MIYKEEYSFDLLQNKVLEFARLYSTEKDITECNGYFSNSMHGPEPQLFATIDFLYTFHILNVLKNRSQLRIKQLDFKLK